MGLEFDNYVEKRKLRRDWIKKSLGENKFTEASKANKII